MKNSIPIYQPDLTGNESKYVNECLKTGWISSRGEFVGRFEKYFSVFLNSGGRSTSVSNGTVALHLALLALGIGKGDEVIVPTFTYIASVNAIAYVGATPVFVDSVPDTWNINIEEIESKITSRTKAVLAVHLYGAPCDMTPLVDICIKNGLKLIEDVAEALGSKYGEKFLGTFGDIATFSFFGNKTITTGEGGMVFSNNLEYIKRAAHLKSQAVSPDKEYWHDEIGFNYRMTNICAAIGVAQIERINDVIESKRKISAWYKEELVGLPLIFQSELEGTKHTYWMVSILLKNRINRDHVRNFLQRKGIETRPLFYPAHLMPAFKNNQTFPVAEKISQTGINLPSFHSLTREQVTYISGQIREALKL